MSDEELKELTIYQLRERMAKLRVQLQSLPHSKTLVREVESIRRELNRRGCWE